LGERSYPFGLTLAGLSSKALAFGEPGNKLKYNGYEQQNQEFTDHSGLEWYDYKHRFYDNQIGRFFVQDRLATDYVYYTPYQFAGNEVPNAIDLDGLEPARQNEVPIDKVNPWAQAKLGKFIPKDDGKSLKEGIKSDLKLAAVFASAFGVGIVAEAILLERVVSEAPGSVNTESVGSQIGESIGEKKVPNPNGKKGGEAHQNGIKEAGKELQEQGYNKIENEVKVETPGGNKESRYVDVQGTNTNTGKIKQVQVGKQNKNGTPASRERKALDDIEEATGVRPEFKPYNPLTPPIKQ